MNLLDKLFSREIQRRTGAHAINIFIDESKKARSRGKKTIKAADKTLITTKPSSSSNKPGSFLHRIDIRFPYLKLVAALIIGVIAILDLCDLTISCTRDRENTIKIAPMSRHVKILERDLSGKMLVALTFDDGPSSLVTPVLLDTLRLKNAPATFFVLGSMARNNPEIVKRAEAEGHEIASHTMYHQNLIRLSADAVKADIDEANGVFASILGHSPSLTRPPYGNTNDNVRSYANTPLILWSVDTLDWQSKNVDSILATAMAEVHDGAIILMHDVYPTSAEAASVLIDTLRAGGYEFVTVSELAKIRNNDLVPGTSYYNFRP